MLGSFIDIHSHILPGVDDGSSDMEETIGMIHMAVAEGIGGIIATPHYQCGGMNLNIKKLVQIYEETKLEIEKIYPDFKFYLGHELLYSESLLEDVKNNKALTLAGSRYVLIEFHTTVSYDTIYRGMKSFIAEGYAPIIAHIERYECVGKQEDRITELIELGCYIQMNSGSLLGGLLNRETRKNKKLVEKGKIHFIASDSHDKVRRVPCMKKVVAVLSNILEEKYINSIFIQNPSKILENKYI